MEIVGHQKILQFLNICIDNNKLSHAYIFYGPPHIGKTTVAQYFAANLMCDSGKACGRCVNCKQILKRIHPDVYWISTTFGTEVVKGKIGIDCIRQVINVLSLEPFSARFKFAIIERAENLTNQAANAFLKFLEEAPSKTIIILITRNFYQILPTLRSRCQILRFSLPPEKEIIRFLKTKFKLDLETIERILALSLSIPGLAIDLAQNPESLIDYEKKLDKVISFLSAHSFEDRLRLANQAMGSNFADLSHLLAMARNLILFKLSNKGLLLSGEGVNEKIRILSEKYTKEKLIQLINQILRTQALIDNNVNKRLAIENLIINSL